MIDLRELGPTFFFAPPAIFENILTQVTIRMEDAGWFKRKMYHYFMGVARRSGSKILEGRRVPPWDRVRYALGRALVYGPLRNVLGFSRLRRVYTAGEAIGPEIFDFYRSLGNQHEAALRPDRGHRSTSRSSPTTRSSSTASACPPSTARSR